MPAEEATAAIYGQLAGCHYGADGIPSEWLEKLHARSLVESLADRLLRLAAVA